MEEAKQVLQKLNGDHQQQQRVVNSKIEIAEKSCPRTNPREYAFFLTIGTLSTVSKDNRSNINGFCIDYLKTYVCMSFFSMIIFLALITKIIYIDSREIIFSYNFQK